MNKRELMKKAHEMTKEIKKEYPEVNYKFQFGLCLSFLMNEEETEMKNFEETIKTLTLEELKEAKELIEKKIAEKSSGTTKKVIYTHDCCGGSSYHFNKYKHWCKLIEDIDSSKTNGFAFIGEFQNCRSENLIDEGSFVVETCGCELHLYLVTGDNEKKLLVEGASSKYATFVRECVEAMNN